MQNKYLLSVLTIAMLMGLKATCQDKATHSVQHEQTHRYEKEITEIMFGKNLEHDNPIYSIERCPTPKLDAIDRCPTPKLDSVDRCPTPKLDAIDRCPTPKLD